MAILEERTRISRELHDSLAQTLGWLSIKTELLEDDLKLGEFEKGKDDITNIRRVVRDACYDVRESIDGLRASPTGNLTATASAWISEFRQRSGLAAEFTTTNGDAKLSAVVEAELLRILQEALTNVRKHAQSRQVWISFKVEENLAELVIEDDGQGFLYQASQASDHFGLRIMRERAERLGGEFQVESTPGKGTRIIAALPVLPVKREVGAFHPSRTIHQTK
jgi:two-component system nitrate/nitrite sensor histidine kinase NarX